MRLANTIQPVQINKNFVVEGTEPEIGSFRQEKVKQHGVGGVGGYKSQAYGTNQAGVGRVDLGVSVNVSGFGGASGVGGAGGAGGAGGLVRGTGGQIYGQNLTGREEFSKRGDISKMLKKKPRRACSILFQ